MKKIVQYTPIDYQILGNLDEINLAHKNMMIMKASL